MLIRIRTAQIRSVFRVWTGTNFLIKPGRTKTRAQKKTAQKTGKQVRKSSSYYLQWIEMWRYDSSHIMKISFRRWWTTNSPTKKGTNLQWRRDHLVLTLRRWHMLAIQSLVVKILFTSDKPLLKKRIMENPKSWLQNFLFGSCSVFILNIEFTSWDCIWKGLKNFFRIWLCRHYPGLARTVKMQVDEWGFLYNCTYIIILNIRYYIRQYRHRCLFILSHKLIDQQCVWIYSPTI